MANLTKKNMSAAKFIHDGVKKDLDRRHGSKFGFQNVSYDNWAKMFPGPAEEKQDTIDIMKKAYGLVRRALDFSFKTRQDGDNLIVEEELNTTQLHTLLRVWYKQKEVGAIMMSRTLGMDKSFGSTEAVDLLNEIIALNEAERKLFSEEYFNYRKAALEKCNKRLY